MCMVYHNYLLKLIKLMNFSWFFSLIYICFSSFYLPLLIEQRTLITRIQDKGDTNYTFWSSLMQELTKLVEQHQEGMTESRTFVLGKHIGFKYALVQSTHYFLTKYSSAPTVVHLKPSFFKSKWKIIKGCRRVKKAN